MSDEKFDISFVNTSVEDLQSSLACAEANGSYIFNSAVLQKAFNVVARRGEKTKASLILRYIKKAIKKERYDGNTRTNPEVEG